jgi:hypothetical protein
MNKLFKYLDGIHNETPFKTEIDILTSILKYYVQEGKPADKETIMGDKVTALLRYKLITPEQSASLFIEKE